MSKKIVLNCITSTLYDFLKIRKIELLHTLPKIYIYTYCNFNSEIVSSGCYNNVNMCEKELVDARRFTIVLIKSRIYFKIIALLKYFRLEN